MPPGARTTSSGRITITMRDHEGRRLSHSKIKADEPVTYGTPDEAWEGYLRVKAHLDLRLTGGVTVREFWAQWSDPEHWRWGNRKRKPQTMRRLRSATTRFVDGHAPWRFSGFGDLPIDAITQTHIETFMEKGGAASSLNALGTFFSDAIDANLRAQHPCKELARDYDEAERGRRKREKPKTPSEAQVERLLARAAEPVYPRSLYAWLRVATDTGMRTGEVDALEWSQFERLPDGRAIYRLDYQYNHSLRCITEPKHDSERKLIFGADLMDLLVEFTGEHPRWVLTNERRNHWRGQTRDWWWSWKADGGPSLREIVGGVPLKNATRHFWAWRALNVWNIPPYKASILYGHKDGGKLMVDTYCDPDNERAMYDVDALRQQAERTERKGRLHVVEAQA